MHGILNVFYIKELTKIFRISTEAISFNNKFTYCFSKYSIPFGVMFIMLSIAFMFSVKKENNIL